MKKTKSTPKMISPKQQRALDSKDTILKIATEIFAEKGLYGARIDAIADAANVNKQRIYAYYGSKSGLYRQVLLSVYATAAENPRIAALSEDDIPNMTTILLEAFFDFHQKNPLFWRLLVWENLNAGQSLSDQDWQQIQSSYIDHIRHLYAKGQQKRLFKQETQYSIYLLMIFSVSFFYYSNQITISHLLNLNLCNKNIKDDLIRQINIMICCGLVSAPRETNSKF